MLCGFGGVAPCAPSAVRLLSTPIQKKKENPKISFVCIE